ncbi:hypothetical protein Salat_1664100 [Sesamum alatum]|uniref:RNase H type-1 domain-containing protein n=1 Tax=Sesamum alatum TaxID=300844 RepID=A0AAE1Y6Q1_9LAMI|nr:hypothetical protein Salat_1664100 [Sesamum alatum]
MICWTVWWSQNLKLARKPFLLPMQVVDFARSYLSAFTAQVSVVGRARSSHQVPWTPPPPGCIKVNFNGVVLDGGTALGLGIVVRDTRGICLSWVSRRLAKRGSAEMAEAYAARESMRLACCFNWCTVIVEGDCNSLIQKLSAPQQDLSEVGPLVLVIHSFIPLMSFVSFSFVRRSGNSVADFLAKHTLNLEGNYAFLPPSLNTVMSGDLAT